MSSFADSMHAGRPEEASGSGEDEAEFAWLPVDCLKPFQPSDAGAAAAADGASNGKLIAKSDRM